MNESPMSREHILSKDCWCKPRITNYCGKDELFEQLAAIEHDRWSDWQKYMHSKGKTHPDDACECREGDLILPKELVDRWERLIRTPYAELSEKEKESDRDQVRRYWKLL